MSVFSKEKLETKVPLTEVAEFGPKILLIMDFTNAFLEFSIIFGAFVSKALKQKNNPCESNIHK